MTELSEAKSELRRLNRDIKELRMLKEDAPNKSSRDNFTNMIKNYQSITKEIRTHIKRLQKW